MTQPRWTTKLSQTAQKQLKNLGPKEVTRIVTFIKEHLENDEDPYHKAVHLSGTFKDYWRFSMGTHRLICDFDDTTLTLLLIRKGHPRDRSA